MLRHRKPGPPRAAFVRWLFLRAMGVTSFCAWRSLARQVRGLYGSSGIAPIADRMRRLEAIGAKDKQLRVPTLFWLDASDRTLLATCAAGQVASALLTLNVAPKYAAAASWAGYLSFATVGSPFLNYQWDALLLEAGLQTIFVAPNGLRPGLGRRAPSWAQVLMFRLLAFRLHFESGSAKWQSRDETWRNFTACAYHQQTQPLPKRMGWFAHHLPAKWQKAVTAGVLASEILIPPLALLPRPFRQIAFATFLGLQAAIQLTGNYGFFNMLTAAVSLWLLDDRDLRRRPRRLKARPRWQSAAELAVLAPIAIATAEEMYSRLRPHPPRPPLDTLMTWASRLRLISPYGLFAVMTTTRPEIILETSSDGATWKELPFRYKPAALNRLPRVAPGHMPRLDWQLWFAALGRLEPWVLSFCARLLQGSKDVASLLPKGALKERPKFIRARLYDYRTTSLKERRESGQWWKRTYSREVLPVISLDPGAPRP